MKYNIGDKIKIVKTQLGCMGCRGHTGIVTNEINTNGAYLQDKGFNVKLDNNVYESSINPEIWRVYLSGRAFFS